MMSYYNGKGKHSEEREIFTLFDGAVSRIIARDGRPLSSVEEEKQERAIQRLVEQHFHDSEDDFRSMRQQVERTQQKRRAIMFEAIEAMDFKFTKEEKVEGRMACAYSFHPKKNFTSRSTFAELFKTIHGEFWIDKADQMWSKAKIKFGRTVIGFPLEMDLPNDLQLQFESKKMDDRIWTPLYVLVNTNQVRGQPEYRKIAANLVVTGMRRFSVTSEIKMVDGASGETTTLLK